MSVEVLQRGKVGRSGVTAFLAAVAVFAATALCAADSPPGGSPQGDVEAFVKAAVVFTRDVHLDEARLEGILANLDSLSEVGNGKKGEELAARALHDGVFDLEVVVADPDYVAWCAAHDQNPRDFFKGLVRLQTLVMRNAVEESAGEVQAQAPEQRRQIEELRNSMGKEAYEKALAAFDANLAELRRMLELVGQIPSPTAAEGALLAKYADRIRAALGSDDSDIERY